MVSVSLLLLAGALVLSAFDVINRRAKEPLSWAVLCIALALLLR